jgi:hypothetical protein
MADELRQSSGSDEFEASALAAGINGTWTE